MALTNSGQVSSITRFLQSNTSAFGTTYSGAPQKDYERFFVSSEITKLYVANYSVTSTPTSIDVTSLTDAFGNAVSFTTVKHLQIVNNSSTLHLTAGGGSNALFAVLPVLTGQAPVTSGQGSNGSCVNLTTALTVDGTHKLIALTASSGTLSVDVFIVGS